MGQGPQCWWREGETLPTETWTELENKSEVCTGEMRQGVHHGAADASFVDKVGSEAVNGEPLRRWDGEARQKQIADERYSGLG